MSELSPCTGVVIVAAGSGTRLGLGVPKAFVEIAGEPMLSHALRGLRELPGRIAVAISVPPGDASHRAQAEALIESEFSHFGNRLRASAVVDGGDNRHESVRAGLAALPADCDIVLIHDAARALATPELFVRIAGAVRATGHGIVPGLPVVDTIKRVDASSRVLETVDRESLRAVQTPQGFPFRALRDAYRQSVAATTDDAASFVAAGGTVEIIRGEASAFKITTPEDLNHAEEFFDRRLTSTEEQLLQHRGLGGATDAGQLRVGVGTDAHAFNDEAPCWLAGIHFPGERGLSGHSDGDAASHAIIDAVLGAAGLGSIGSVFGTSDPRFENAHGEVFLTAVRELLTAAGAQVQNVSVQVICQRPRFDGRAAEASEVLTEALGAPVAVSATTSDGLGFTGNSEGVFAIATALVVVPGPVAS